jgi:hypothetical protein
MFLPSSAGSWQILVRRVELVGRLKKVREIFVAVSGGHGIQLFSGM